MWTMECIGVHLFTHVLGVCVGVIQHRICVFCVQNEYKIYKSNKIPLSGLKRL